MGAETQVLFIVILLLVIIALTIYIVIKHFQGKRRPLTSNLALHTALKKIADDGCKEMDGEQVNWKATCEIMKSLARATLEMVDSYEKENTVPPEKAQERAKRKGGH